MKTPNLTLPLYRRIYDDIEQKILTGQIAYREQLPALPDLCRIYGVSEAPVRQALAELQRDGLVLKQRGRGKGTFSVKNLAARTIRVLMMGDIDIYRNPIETVHEIFDMLAGIREAARELGADVQLISPTSNDTLALAGGNTGYLIIAQGSRGYERGREIAAGHGVPSVLVNPPDSQAPCVRVDMEEAAFLGVNYLAKLGHRHIAYVGGTTGEWFTPRYAGYLRALEVNHLVVDNALVCHSDGVTTHQDEAALDTLMALEHPPTAIFAATDYRALHLLAHARRKRIAIPQRLSLCGYDNISEVAGVEPALTTVHHPRFELGSEAVRLLGSLLAGENGERAELQDVRVPPHVVVRASCTSPHN